MTLRYFKSYDVNLSRGFQYFSILEVRWNMLFALKHCEPVVEQYGQWNLRF